MCMSKKQTNCREQLKKKWVTIIDAIEKNPDCEKALIQYLSVHLNIYNQFILTRLNRCVNTNKFESHHIFPKSIGGPDKSWNLINLTVKEHHQAHIYRYSVYHEYIDKLALSFFGQFVDQRKAAQLLGSQAAVMLKRCGFQNPAIQKKAAEKGRHTLTLKKKQSYFARLSPLIKKHLLTNQVWVYLTKNKKKKVLVNARRCLTLTELVEYLEQTTGISIGKKGKLTTKTNGLSKVIKGVRKSYANWSYEKESAAH